MPLHMPDGEKTLTSIQMDDFSGAFEAYQLATQAYAFKTVINCYMHAPIGYTHCLFDAQRRVANAR